MKSTYVVLAAVASVVLAMGGLFVAIAPQSGQALPAPSSAADSPVFHRAHAPARGNPAAKVEIVEFLDPACSTCREFYPLVKKMLADDPDRVRLTVRHVAFHRGSDVVVRSLEASKKQGRYWDVLETLLRTQPAWVEHHTVKAEQVWPQLASSGLDVDKLKADMESTDVVANVALDMQDAKALKVTQTPEYFVNGRPLPSFGYDELRQLVAQAVAREYR